MDYDSDTVEIIPGAGIIIEEPPHTGNRWLTVGERVEFTYAVCQEYEDAVHFHQKTPTLDWGGFIPRHCLKVEREPVVIDHAFEPPLLDFAKPEGGA